MISLRKFIASILSLPFIAKSGLISAATHTKAEEIQWTMRSFTLEHGLCNGQRYYRIKCSCGWSCDEFVKPDVIFTEGQPIDWHCWPEYDQFKKHQPCDGWVHPRVEHQAGRFMGFMDLNKINQIIYARS